MNRSVLLICIFTLLVNAGCAASRIAAGDNVAIHYTCRLSNGDLAATTDKVVAEATAVPRSAFYFPKASYSPVLVTAGTAKPSTAFSPFGKSFEDSVADHLALLLPGLGYGRTEGVKLTGEATPGSNPVSIARVRTRMKEIRLAPATFTAETGMQPEVGQPYVEDPALPGRVEEVNGNEVVIRIPPPGRIDMPTPFGMATIRDQGDHYEIVIEARPGYLFRTGPLVGRISAVTEQTIVLDFSHPFAGETLWCDITASRSEPPVAAVAGRVSERGKAL